MKTKFFFLLSILPVYIFGQSPCPGLTGGNLTAEVNGHSVVLKDDSAYRNCGSYYVMEITCVSPDTLVWKQRDVGAVAFCDCLFNYSTTVDSLKTGNYVAKVYYTITANHYCYIGSVSFSVMEPFPTFSPYLANTYQSTCLEMGIQSYNLSSGVNIRIFPNPTDAELNIITDLHGSKLITISDVNSKCVYEFRTENEKNSIDLSFFPRNIYFVTVSNKDKSIHAKFCKN